MNASFLNIATEWLSDIKRGHCTTAFYLNEDFCCWGANTGMFFLGWEFWGLVLMRCGIGCSEWVPWSSNEIANYFIYIIFSVCGSLYGKIRKLRLTSTWDRFFSHLLPLSWLSNLRHTLLDLVFQRLSALSPALS